MTSILKTLERLLRTDKKSKLAYQIDHRRAL